jgi:hypothetical protein
VTAVSSTSGLRALLASPAFLRLWGIGFCANTMRGFEVLVAALFTLDATGSGFAVAAVTAARTLPMFFLGAFAGVAAEAWDRKRLLVAGQAATCCASLAVALLAWSEALRPWHIAMAATVAGMVWSTEMATRRRMVGECVAPALVSRALALDTMTNSLTRLLGPVCAGLAYQWVGVAGAFAFSACVYAVAAEQAACVRHRQQSRPLVLRRVPSELLEGVAFVRRDPVIAGVLGTTVAMNLLVFSYAALIAPIGRLVYHVPPSEVGLLAGAEALGAFLGGIWLTLREPRTNGRILMVGGSLLFAACVVVMPVLPLFPLACLLMVAGGTGSAAFANMQTSLIVLHAPSHIRSRLMGLLTVCIGMNPLGILLVGAIADVAGPGAAMSGVASVGFLAVAAVGIAWRRREGAGR